MRDPETKKNRLIYASLFVTAALIYLINFPHILLQPNSVLSNNNEDALKNYYTFVYHIKHDSNPLHFSGMGYPYGEHAVYTDCQPIVGFVLKLLPFTHDHLIGIMHWLIFLTFMVTPLLLYRILTVWGSGKFTAFFSALAIGLLSPQFHKLNLGHYALAYTCVIPITIILLQNYFRAPGVSKVLWLAAYHFILFLLHPYIGFSVSLFAFLSIGLTFFTKNEKSRITTLAQAAAAGLLPILLFKLFMLLTDRHPPRATEPFGLGNWNSGIGGIFIPEFGPFREFLLAIFKTPTDNFEAPAYIGIFLIVCTAVFLLSLPFIFRLLKFEKGPVALLVASLFLLAFSFGLHQKVLDLAGISIPALNQFRATGRFAWFFYYMLPIVLIVAMNGAAQTKKTKNLLAAVALFYFIFNLVEAVSYFRKDDQEHWTYRNIFNKNQLTEEEKKNIRLIQSKKTQAIFPLRYFHGGSEMYERPGIYSSMPPSILYSYHTGLPTSGLFLSRSSLTETEELISLLNSYKTDRDAAKWINSQPFTIIRDNLELFPDEKRLSDRVTYFAQSDSVQIGFIAAKDFLLPKKDTAQLKIPYTNQESPVNGVVFIPYAERKPFVPAKMINDEKFFELDSNLVESGDYVVSLHFNYNEKTYKAIGLNLIVTRTQGNDYEWLYNASMRALSGFYKGFGVLEYRIYIDKHCKYEFLMKGFYDRDYTISSFMLRPEKLTVITQNKNQTLINNFPATD